ncbi:hypothetical protein VPH35_124621 [Triticum aestivum]
MPLLLSAPRHGPPEANTAQRLGWPSPCLCTTSLLVACQDRLHDTRQVHHRQDHMDARTRTDRNASSTIRARLRGFTKYLRMRQVRLHKTPSTTHVGKTRKSDPERSTSRGPCTTTVALEDVGVIKYLSERTRTTTVARTGPESTKTPSTPTTLNIYDCVRLPPPWFSTRRREPLLPLPLR